MSLAMAEFAIVSAAGASECVVQAVGELDAYVAPTLKETLRQALASGATTVTVDMAAVSFVDSTALGVFIKAFKDGQRVDITLALRDTTATVTRVLEITGLRSLLTMPPTVDNPTPPA
jgi:anti-sigma B factor antagonist